MPMVTVFRRFADAVNADMERFRTERLVARSWQIEDLPLALELWGDPAVTALIDSRGKLTKAQVNESAPRSSERDPAVFSIGRCSITAMAISLAAAGFGLGSIHLTRRISKWGSIS